MKLRYFSWIVIAMLLLAAKPVYPLDVVPQPPEGYRVTKNLIGSWSGTGTLFGAPAEFAMEWQWVLGASFLQLTFENRMSRAKGDDIVLNAKAFYQFTDNDGLEGTWFDSRGMKLPLNATFKDSALVTLWGTPDTEQGRTVYKVVSNIRIDVEDFVLKEGEWKKFGEAIYRRD